MEFKPSLIEQCVWFRGNIIFRFYIDDGIIWEPRDEGIDQFLIVIRNNELTKQNFDTKEKGDMSVYLGINFERQDNELILLS